jgi:hypothetical protein
MREREDPVEVLVARLGADRAAALLAELDLHGLVAVDAASLDQLEREAAGYRRLAALVDEPSD